MYHSMHDLSSAIHAYPGVIQTQYNIELRTRPESQPRLPVLRKQILLLTIIVMAVCSSDLLDGLLRCRFYCEGNLHSKSILPVLVFTMKPNAHYFVTFWQSFF